jgi:hypothetical protein
MWLSADNEASRLMAMNSKPRLYQRVAFNLIVAVVIGLCFGARSGVAQQSTVGEWSSVSGPTWPEFPVHAHLLPTGKVMIWPGDQGIIGNNQQPQSWNPADQSVSPLAPSEATIFFALATRSWPTEGYSLRVATSTMALELRTQVSTTPS